VAELPAGTRTTFMHGRALSKNGEKSLSEFRPGEGVQYCFKEFNEAWVKLTSEIPK